MSIDLTEVIPRPWRVVQLSGDLQADTLALADVIEELGTPLHVFQDYPFWKAFDVDPTRPPTRSGGVGLNSLHVDCVNMQSPPDYVVLYCGRPDPHGGGASLVAQVQPAVRGLSSQSLATLSQPRFTDGAAHNLFGVGDDANPFAVIDDDWPGIRYTGRLLETASNSEQRSALLELDRLLMLEAESFVLNAGEALIVDQRLAVHGRLALGPNQEDLDPDKRRLLVQAFIRGRE